MAIVLSPNMQLPVPSVGIEAGPQYAEDINNCLGLLDSHNHSSGQGVQIDPSGLNINSDLPMAGNNLTVIRSLRLDPQDAIISEPEDLACIYAVDDDLYFNDGLGNQIRLTQNGAVAGTPGSIANLASPASASYVAAQEKFVWESDTNTPADMDMGAAILRKISAGSPSITIQPPVTLSSDYSITLPATTPSEESFVTMDSSGNVKADIPIDEGIDLTMLAASIQAALNPAGTILMTGRTTAPTGYLLCDGSAVSRTTYSDLFTAIGTAFGSGNGTTTFNVPDLRGRFIRGVDGAAGRDPDSAGRTSMNSGGNTGNNVGSVQGFAFQAHTHSYVYDDLINTGGPPIAGGAGYFLNDNISGTSGAASGVTSTETRPRNAYVNFMIKT